MNHIYYRILSFIPYILSFYSLLVSSGGHGDVSNSMDEGKYIRLVVLLIAFFLSIFIMVFKKIKFPSSDFRLLFLFILISIFSAIWSDNPTATIAKIFEFSVFVTVTYTAAYCCSASNAIKSIKFSIFIIIGYYIIYSIYYNLSVHGAIFDYNKTSTTFGFSLVIVGLYFLIKNNNPLILIGSLVASILIGSRTSFGIGILGWFLSVWINLGQKSQFNKKMIIITIMIIFVVIFILMGGVTQLLRGQSAEDFLSLTGRTTHWIHAFNMIKDNPFFGYGYFSGVRYTATYSYEAYKNYGFEFSTFDNSYLDLLVSVGFIGSFPLVYYYILSIKKLKSIIVYYKCTIYKPILLFAYIFVFLSMVRALMAPVFPFAHWNLLIILYILILANRLVSILEYEKRYNS